MTVGELRKRLEGLPDDMPVLLREPVLGGNWEDALTLERSTATRLGLVGWSIVTMGDEDEESVVLLSPD